MEEFPQSLVCLRLSLFEGLARTNKSYNLNHLINLRYLVVSDPALRSEDIKKLVKFSI
jgi:hypothetical protein